MGIKPGQCRVVGILQERNPLGEPRLGPHCAHKVVRIRLDAADNDEPSVSGDFRRELAPDINQQPLVLALGHRADGKDESAGRNPEIRWRDGIRRCQPVGQRDHVAVRAGHCAQLAKAGDVRVGCSRNAQADIRQPEQPLEVLDHSQLDDARCCVPGEGDRQDVEYGRHEGDVVGLCESLEGVEVEADFAEHEEGAGVGQPEAPQAPG